MATDRPRFSISLDDETFERVERYQESKQFSTRSKAVEALIWEGLEAFGVQSEPKEKAPPISDEALRVAIEYDSAGDTDREIVRLALGIEIEDDDNRRRRQRRR